MTKDDYCKSVGSCVLDCGGKSERAASVSDISERKGEGVAVALRAKHLKFDVPRLTSSCPQLCIMQATVMVSDTELAKLQSQRAEIWHEYRGGKCAWRDQGRFLIFVFYTVFYAFKNIFGYRLVTAKVIQLGGSYFHTIYPSGVPNGSRGQGKLQKIINVKKTYSKGGLI